MAFPLYHLTGKKPFILGKEQQAAFCALKKALTSPPVLALPTPNGEFVLDQDKSSEVIEAELFQIQDGQKKTIAYGSLSLSTEQRIYCTIRKELLSVVRFNACTGTTCWDGSSLCERTPIVRYGCWGSDANRTT